MSFHVVSSAISFISETIFKPFQDVVNLKCKTLLHSRSLLCGSQELLQKVTTSSNVANIVSKIQDMTLMTS